jgi:hypothetical protein
MEFINLATPANGGGPVGALQVDKTNRRRIRIQVMKDFRRKKQQRKAVRKMDHSIMATSWYLELIVQVHTEAPDVLSPSADSLVPRIPPPVSCQTVWRLSFAHRMTEGWFPEEYRPAAMQNIVYTYESLGSAPVVAIQDALSMLHVGSVSRSDHILNEARRKYALAVNSLRLSVTGKRLEMPVSQAMILGTITVMSEVRSFSFFFCA